LALTWNYNKISEIIEVTQGRVTQIINNANFCGINNLLPQGHDMHYIARQFHIDLALARAYGGKKKIPGSNGYYRSNKQVQFGL